MDKISENPVFLRFASKTLENSLNFPIYPIFGKYFKLTVPLRTRWWPKCGYPRNTLKTGVWHNKTDRTFTRIITTFIMRYSPNNGIYIFSALIRWDDTEKKLRAHGLNVGRGISAHLHPFQYNQNASMPLMH